MEARATWRSAWTRAPVASHRALVPDLNTHRSRCCPNTALTTPGQIRAPKSQLDHSQDKRKPQGLCKVPCLDSHSQKLSPIQAGCSHLL